MSVLSSRRLWTFILAQVMTLATLFINHYVVDPFMAQVTPVIITTVQGLAAILITAYTVDDIKGNEAQKEIELNAIAQGTHPDFPQQFKL